jgi:magnesium-transporting ATPase (P-type)
MQGEWCATGRPFLAFVPAASHTPAHSFYFLLLVQFTGKHTFFGKTATMLQAADGIGHLAQILLRIMIVLVTISVMLCVAILIFLIVYGKEEFATALEFVVVVLVASVPIAIEVVCTATLALGSRQLSAHGAIVTRLASVEEMAGMNMVSLHIEAACLLVAGPQAACSLHRAVACLQTAVPG